MKLRQVQLLKALAAVMIVLGVGAPFPSLASTKTISSVTIYVGMDEMELGETLPGESSFETSESGGNYVYSNNERYTVNELEWITSDSKEMTVGYEPKMKVTLGATDADTYAFKGGYSSSNVSVKGGTFVSANRSGSDTLYVTFKFKPIKGTYESPDDAYWKESGYGGARWSAPESGGSGAYDVYLYRGGTLVKKVERLKATAYNFFPYMTREGAYTFKVRTVPYSDSEEKYGKKSDWTESDEVYLPKEHVSDGSGQGDGAFGSDSVGWVKENDTWYYRYPDGSYIKNVWAKINNKWYLFGSNGAMLTGWQQRGDLWYYMDGDGAMQTGWVFVNNKWYYLNPSATNGSEGAMQTGWISYNNKWYCTDATGAMLEGWREVGGNWYYFYPGEGSKAVNTTINGFQVDGSGIWHKPETR